MKNLEAMWDDVKKKSAHKIPSNPLEEEHDALKTSRRKRKVSRERTITVQG
jgi:hypothetical protein